MKAYEGGMCGYATYRLCIHASSREVSDRTLDPSIPVLFLRCMIIPKSPDSSNGRARSVYDIQYSLGIERDTSPTGLHPSSTPVPWFYFFEWIGRKRSHARAL